MSYFEFEDIKRLHQPYTDPIQKAPAWKTPYNNSAYLNLKRGLICTTAALVIHEPIYHFCWNAHFLNQFYEWPKNTTEANIFFREVFRMPNFWSEFRKRMTFGFVHAGMDVGV